MKLIKMCPVNSSHIFLKINPKGRHPSRQVPVAHLSVTQVSDSYKPYLAKRQSTLPSPYSAGTANMHSTYRVSEVLETPKLLYRPYRSRQLQINVDHLHAFLRAFIFIRELAKPLACYATNLADKLISAGLKPVHVP